MEVKAVHPSPWGQEDTAFLVKMTTHIHQDLKRRLGSNAYTVQKDWTSSFIDSDYYCVYLVKVDDHGTIAHICRFMVGLASGREGHSASPRTY